MVRPVAFAFDAQLWQWDARRADTWVFVTVPADVSSEIRDMTGATTRGFGSVRVQVSLGGSRWATSIFPDASRGSFVLPVKKAVRRAEKLDVGDLTTVTIELTDL
jgi:hypothetical protein